MVRTAKLDPLGPMFLQFFLLTEVFFQFSEVCRLFTGWCIIIVVVGIYKLIKKTIFLNFLYLHQTYSLISFLI